jgi:pyruvate/2-oxoglutarate/acetoin dehydrogenase E1 component
MRTRSYAESIQQTLDELAAAHPAILFLHAGDGAGAPAPRIAPAGRSLPDGAISRQYHADGATGIASAALGLALAGWHPLATLTPPASALVALQHLWIHLANATSPAVSHAPLVLRVPLAGGPALGQFTGLGTFRVAAPYTARDAAELLRDAVARAVPVLYLEDCRLYPRSDDSALPLSGPEGAVIRRPGRDVTLVAFSAMVGAALRAAEALAERGIEAEVIDPRTLAPFDQETVTRSVWRTHRALVVDEGETPLGPSLAAGITSAAFDELDAPVEVVRVPAGAASLSEAIARGAEAVVRQVRWLLGEKADPSRR